MTYMLCRNRVADLAKWRGIFTSHAQAHRDAGLRLVRTWRGVEDANDVFFMFEVSSIERAKAFISAPAAAEAGIASGVIEGEYHFIQDTESY
jgi:hypothetical protein